MAFFKSYGYAHPLWSNNGWHHVSDFYVHILSGDGGGGLITTNIFPNFIDFANNANREQLISTTELIGLIDTTKTISTVELMNLIASNNTTQGGINASADFNLMERFMNTRTDTIKDTGKLLVWCFIAGYSEKFITGILSTIESRGAKIGNVDKVEEKVS